MPKSWKTKGGHDWVGPCGSKGNLDRWFCRKCKARCTSEKRPRAIREVPYTCEKNQGKWGSLSFTKRKELPRECIYCWASRSDEAAKANRSARYACHMEVVESVMLT